MNFDVKINLLKLKKAAVANIQGKTGMVKCLVIPIEENDLFVSIDENNKAKSVYLDMTAWEARNQKYDDTHYLKQSFSKEKRALMSADEVKNVPILGGLIPFETEKTNAAKTADAPFMDCAYDDALPF